MNTDTRVRSLFNDHPQVNQESREEGIIFHEWLLYGGAISAPNVRLWPIAATAL